MGLASYLNNLIMERRGEIDGRKNGDRDDIQRIHDGCWSLPECVGAVCPQPRLHRRVHHQLQRAVSGAEPVQRLRGETQHGGEGVLFLPFLLFFFSRMSLPMVLEYLVGCVGFCFCWTFHQVEVTNRKFVYEVKNVPVETEFG